MSERLPGIAEILGQSDRTPSSAATVAQTSHTAENPSTLVDRLQRFSKMLSKRVPLGPNSIQKDWLAANFSRLELFTIYVPAAHKHPSQKESQPFSSHQYTDADIVPSLRDIARSWNPKLTVSSCEFSHHLSAESLRTGVTRDVAKTGSRLIHSTKDLAEIIRAGGDTSNPRQEPRVGYADSTLTIEWEAPLGTYIPHSTMDATDEKLWLPKIPDREKVPIVSVSIAPAPGAWLSLITRAEFDFVDTAATGLQSGSYHHSTPADNRDLYED